MQVGVWGGASTQSSESLAATIQLRVPQFLLGPLKHWGRPGFEIKTMVLAPWSLLDGVAGGRCKGEPLLF